MKTTQLKTLSIALVAIVSLPLASLRAHEGHDHGKPPAPEAGTSAEAWTNAQASLKAMQSAAASKDQGRSTTSRRSSRHRCNTFSKKASAAPTRRGSMVRSRTPLPPLRKCTSRLTRTTSTKSSRA
jgi:hypothetical protein